MKLKCHPTVALLRRPGECEDSFLLTWMPVRARGCGETWWALESGTQAFQHLLSSPQVSLCGAQPDSMGGMTVHSLRSVVL